MRKKKIRGICAAIALVLTVTAAGCGNQTEQAVVQEEGESSLENGLETEESRKEKPSEKETEEKTELSGQEIEALEEEGKLKEKDADAAYEVLETQITEDGKVLSIEKDEKTGETVTVVYDSKEEVGSDTGKVVETKPGTSAGGNRKPTAGTENRQGNGGQKPGTTAAQEKPGNAKPGNTKPESTKPTGTKPAKPETKPTKAPTPTTAAPTQAPTQPPTTAAPTQPPATAAPTPSYSTSQAIQDLLKGINETRVNRFGVAPITLGYENGLMTTAQAQAEAMAAADTGDSFHSHTQPGQTGFRTDEACGVVFSYEVCYEAFYTNGQFVPYHAKGVNKDNIKTCGIGVAVGASGHYYICVQCYAGK